MFTTVPGAGTDNRFRIVGLAIMAILLLPLDTEGRFVRMSSFSILAVGILIATTLLAKFAITKKRERDIRRREKDFEGIFGKPVPNGPDEAQSMQADVRLTIVIMTADCLRAEKQTKQMLQDSSVNKEVFDSACRQYSDKYRQLRQAFDLARYYGLGNKNSMSEGGS